MLASVRSADIRPGPLCSENWKSFHPQPEYINGFFAAPQLSAWSFHKVFSCFLPFHVSFSSNYIPFGPCIGSLNKTKFW